MLLHCVLLNKGNGGFKFTLTNPIFCYFALSCYYCFLFILKKRDIFSEPNIKKR